MKLMIPLLFIMIFISGCVEKIVYVDKNVYKYYKIPSTVIVDDINITKLPDRNLYIHSNPIEREILLRDTILHLTSDVYRYKNKLHTIHKYDINITTIIEQKNKEAKTTDEE